MRLRRHLNHRVLLNAASSLVRLKQRGSPPVPRVGLRAPCGIYSPDFLPRAGRPSAGPVGGGTLAKASSYVYLTVLLLVR